MGVEAIISMLSSRGSCWEEDFLRGWLRIWNKFWVVQAIIGKEWRSKGAGSASFVRLEGVVIPHHFFDACEMTWWCQKWISPTVPHVFQTFEFARDPSPRVVLALIEGRRARIRKGRMRSRPKYELSSHVVLMARVANARRRSAM